MLTEITTFSIDIRAAPRTNRCRHCWTYGSACNRDAPIRRAPVEQVFFVLDKLAQARAQVPQRAFFLYDEPTAHP